MSQEDKRPFNKAEFQELGRVAISSTVNIVVSEVYKKGVLLEYNINRYILTDGYDGFVKGQAVPVSHLTEFLKLFPKKNLEDTLKET